MIRESKLRWHAQIKQQNDILENLDKNETKQDGQNHTTENTGGEIDLRKNIQSFITHALNESDKPPHNDLNIEKENSSNIPNIQYTPFIFYRKKECTGFIYFLLI